ncbi:hypothetical protein IH979_01770 [Patescibacteria group bacterium]|nr:hypothetical protein [Patescibacteria group bacterium]
MDIKTLLQKTREIWGDQKLSLAQIIVRMNVMLGDLARWDRDADKDKAKHTEDELKKELGNFIFSTIRWCDDLGYDPEECIELAREAQRKFVEENKSR